jgi:AcrR family transcriptional regulator
METGTRTTILLAAERLFADRGFGVSLREIGAAAGQRNHSAVQYHFGTRERLITALFEHRMVPLNRRRMELVAELRAAGRERDITALVDAYVRPLAEHIQSHRGASWYLRFAARLALAGIEVDLPIDDAYLEGVNALTAMLADVVPDVSADRMHTLSLHVAMVLARLELRCEDPAFGDDQADDVAADLVSTATAVLAAPRAPAWRRAVPTFE